MEWRYSNQPSPAWILPSVDLVSLSKALQTLPDEDDLVPLTTTFLKAKMEFLQPVPIVQVLQACHLGSEFLATPSNLEMDAWSLGD